MRALSLSVTLWLAAATIGLTAELDRAKLAGTWKLVSAGGIQASSDEEEITFRDVRELWFKVDCNNYEHMYDIVDGRIIIIERGQGTAIFCGNERIPFERKLIIEALDGAEIIAVGDHLFLNYENGLARVVLHFQRRE